MRKNNYFISHTLKVKSAEYLLYGKMKDDNFFWVNNFEIIIKEVWNFWYRLMINTLNSLAYHF